MKYISLALTIIFGLPIIAAAKPEGKKAKPFSHKLQLETMYLHLGDPDWKNVWQRRNLIPQYQIGYDRFYLKARFFSLGTYSGHSTDGIINLAEETLPNGKTRVKEGSVVYREGYYAFDLLASIAIMHNNRHTILVGIGGTHRRGIDDIQRYDPLNQTLDIGDGEEVNIDEWGGIAEVSYSVSFLKYLVASAEAGYRVYPASTSMFTVGIGLGLQIHHGMPSFLLRKKRDGNTGIAE